VVTVRLTAWPAPTLRAIGWTPLVAVALTTLLVAGAVRATGASPAELVPLAAAAMAAALVAGLHDPAAELLAALPASAVRRRTHRLVLLAPAVLALWTALVGLGRLTTSPWGPGWPYGPLVALTLAGLAVAVLVPPAGAMAAGVGAPLVWLALSRAPGGLGGPLGDLATAWQTHPCLVGAVTAPAVLIGGRR
jgi:hypothetical protein